RGNLLVVVQGRERRHRQPRIDVDEPAATAAHDLESVLLDDCLIVYATAEQARDPFQGRPRRQSAAPTRPVSSRRRALSKTSSTVISRRQTLLVQGVFRWLTAVRHGLQANFL